MAQIRKTYSKQKDVKSVHLDQKFWAQFSSQNWEKKALKVENFKSSIQEMDESEVFKLLVSFSHQCRRNKDPQGFKFYIHGNQAHESDILQILPTEKDQSFLGYHARMEKMFSDYCLVCDELLTVHSERRSNLTNFTEGLYKQVGLPNRFSEMGLYLGNYQKTPFGVHVDRCGVFSFPIVGQKKFRLWTSEFVKKNPELERAFKYEKFKKNSTVITARPGDMTYWPSSAWHIAESDGSFSATWSLGVWVDQDHLTHFTDHLTEILKSKNILSHQNSTTKYHSLHSSSGEVTHLPEAFQESIRSLRSLSHLELTESFNLMWLQHMSKQGLKNSPKSLSRLNLTSTIQLRNLKAPVLWYSRRSLKNTIYYSFAGILVESINQKELFSLVLKLNQGQICRVGDFIKSTKLNKQLETLNQIASAGVYLLK